MRSSAVRRKKEEFGIVSGDRFMKWMYCVDVNIRSCCCILNMVNPVWDESRLSAMI